MAKRVLLPVLMACAIAAFADAAVSSQQVRQAIERGIANVRGSQTPVGTFAPELTTCGMTALATFTLLMTGVPATDPSVRAGLNILSSLSPFRVGRTYDISLQIMALATADPARYRRQIQECASWLIRAEVMKAGGGVWTYVPAGSGFDHSNTQFAVMGLDAAERAGVTVPKEIWKRIADHYKQAQCPDGGWGYRLEKSSYGSMTAAGVASLALAGEVHEIRRLRAVNHQTGAACCGEYRQNPSLARGISWLIKNFSVAENPGRGQTYYYYYLYALERVGMLAGQRTLGPYDWYALGAEQLLARQQADGGWGRLDDTCFALLFLAKGRRPVLVNKLAYKGDWDVDRHGIQNLCGFIETQTGTPVAWQVVTLDDPLELWMSAPILYFQGSAFPRFRDEDKARLRQFVDQGGTVLAEAGCGNKGFADGMREFAAEVFPAHALSRLSASHPVFESFFPIERRFDLEGMDIGCRTAIFFAPMDLSCLWEQVGVRVWSEAALRLGTNLAVYVMGENPLGDRLQQLEQAADRAESRPAPEGALQVAQLAYKGGWFPLPLTLVRLAETLREKAGLTVVARPAIVEMTDENILNYPISYMTGQDDFELSDKQRTALKKYLDRGGTLIVDPCCGAGGFDRGFRREMAALYGPGSLKPLPPDHAIVNGSVGFALSTVRYRQAVARREPALSTVRLEAVETGGRLAVIYSPYNFSCGLDGSCGSACAGLAQSDAVKLAVNLFLFALQQ